MPNFKKIEWDSPFPQPTCLHLFPPQFKFLEQHPAIKREHFVDTHTIMCNGSVMPSKPTVEALLHKAGKDIFFQGSYGIPEVPYCFMMEPGSKNNHLLTSVGRPLANTVAKVFDLSTGSGLGAYEEGEIGIKGPQVYLLIPACERSKAHFYPAF